MTKKTTVPASLSDAITKYLAKNPSATAVKIAADLTQDRKQVSVELRKLRDAGKVVSSGQTRATVYVLAGA